MTKKVKKTKNETESIKDMKNLKNLNVNKDLLQKKKLKKKKNRNISINPPDVENLKKKELNNKGNQSTNNSEDLMTNNDNSVKEICKTSIMKAENNEDQVINSNRAKRKDSLKKKREETKLNRKMIRAEYGNFAALDNLSVEDMKNRISEIESRDNISKTAIRKLRVLKKKLQVKEGLVDEHTIVKRKGSFDNDAEKKENKKFKKDPPLPEKNDLFVEDRIGNRNPDNIDNESNHDEESGPLCINKSKKSLKQLKKEKKKILKKLKTEKFNIKDDKVLKEKVKKEPLVDDNKIKSNRLINKDIKNLNSKCQENNEEHSSSEDIEGEDIASDENSSNDDVSTVIEHQSKNKYKLNSPSVKNKSKKNKKDQKTSDFNNGIENINVECEENEKQGSSDDMEAEKSESDSNSSTDKDKSIVLNQKPNNKNLNNIKKNQRYVLFVGNVSYNTTTVDIKKHFLTKVSKIKDVRIPIDPVKKHPRGIAYVEVENSIDFEKGLSLHNTFLTGRKIKVEYTRSGSKNASKNQIVIQKNKKLHAMRKAGMLAGSKKNTQKRSFRRKLQRDANDPSSKTKMQ